MLAFNEKGHKNIGRFLPRDATLESAVMPR